MPVIALKGKQPWLSAPNWRKSSRSSSGNTRQGSSATLLCSTPSRRAYLDGAELDFSRPGKPTDNAFIESFNGRFRQECLNENWFLSLEDAKEEVESWRNHYNGERPHSALGNLSPREFAVLAEMEIDPQDYYYGWY